MRTIRCAALGLCLSITGASLAQEARPAPLEPGRLSLPQLPPALSANQQLANNLGERLRQNANLRQYRVDISVTGGIVELSGTVTDSAQRDEVVRTVQATPGVERVRDHLSLAQAGVVTAQAKSDIEPLPPAAGPAGAAPPEPTPIFTTNPAIPNPSLQPPPLPPYAWPTYAPYNNYSRVGYPTQYPYESWPFIGPQYPFPKVPLGWRAVTLRWEDGYWFYGRSPTGHDWWRIRYW